MFPHNQPASFVQRRRLFDFHGTWHGSFDERQIPHQKILYSPDRHRVFEFFLLSDVSSSIQFQVPVNLLVWHCSFLPISAASSSKLSVTIAKPLFYPGGVSDPWRQRLTEMAPNEAMNFSPRDDPPLCQLRLGSARLTSGYASMLTCGPLASSKRQPRLPSA